MIADYLPAFPFLEGPTIHLVDKMDQAFATLLTHAADLPASSAISGIKHIVSVTDRVRIRSVIESTRIIAVETAANRSASVDIHNATEALTDTDYASSSLNDGDERDLDSLNMSITKMYERSLSILGDSLG